MKAAVLKKGRKAVQREAAGSLAAGTAPANLSSIEQTVRQQTVRLDDLARQQGHRHRLLMLVAAGVRPLGLMCASACKNMDAAVQPMHKCWKERSHPARPHSPTRQG